MVIASEAEVTMSKKEQVIGTAERKRMQDYKAASHVNRYYSGK